MLCEGKEYISISDTLLHYSNNIIMYYIVYITFTKRYDFIHYINPNALFSVLLICQAAGCCFSCCCYYLFCFGCCCDLCFPSNRQYDIPEDYWLWYENESIRTSDYWSSSKADHDDDKKTKCSSMNLMNEPITAQPRHYIHYIISHPQKLMILKRKLKKLNYNSFHFNFF